MNVETKNKSFRAVVGDDVIIERLATGFLFTEGPVWHPHEGHLTFSDIPGDQMYRWTLATGVTSFRRPSNKANGNAYDARGRLVTCEHATSRVVRDEGNGGCPSAVRRFPKPQNATTNPRAPTLGVSFAEGSPLAYCYLPGSSPWALCAAR